MAYIEWKIEKTEVNYTDLEATYTGTTKKGNRTYTDVVKYLLSNAMLQSFSDPNMQQWQGFIQAVNELTGVTDWIVDADNRVIYYPQVNPELPTYPMVWRWNTFIGSSADSVCDQILPYDQSQYPVYNSVKTELIMNSDTSATCYLYNKDDQMKNLYTIAYQVNPNYDPQATEEKEALPFDVVAQQIVLNTQSSDQATSLLAEAYIDEVAKSFVTPVFDDSVVPPDIPLDIPDYVCSIDDGFLDYPKMARDKYTYMFDTLEFDALMQTIIEQRSQRQCEYLQLKKYLLDIDHAEGDALDVIGRYLGQPRALINFIVDPYFGFKGALQSEAFNIGTWYTLNAASRGSIRVLNDELYRNVIKARIIKNNSSNSRDDLIAVLKLLGAKSFKLKYNRHGVISVRISNRDDVHGLVAYYISKYMDDNSIIPRQLGYRIGISVEKEMYMTSLPYPVYSVESFSSTPAIDTVVRGVRDGFKDTIESFNTNFAMESIQFSSPLNEVEFIENFNTSFSLEGINIIKQVEYKAYNSGIETFNSSFSLEGINISKQVAYISTTVPIESFNTSFAIDSIQITN